MNTLSYEEVKNFLSEKEKNFYRLNDVEDIKKMLDELQNDNRKSYKQLANKASKIINKYESELLRVNGMYSFDRQYGSNILIAGVDEVGRGPFAGPIVAAAVILNLKCDNSDIILGINDSKKLNRNLRNELSKIIKEKAVSYSISEIDNHTIDKKGIGWSNNEVFRLSCQSLSVKPDLVLSDGYPIRNFNMRNEFVVKGDTKSASIACASIIAKVYRDNLMIEYAKKYPNYDFEHNVGYGTKEHIAAIKTYGITDIHRRSFLKNIYREK